MSIVVLVAFLIFLSALYFGGKGNEAASYLGFAGTVSSIILSVVAIVYTMYQSTNSLIQAKDVDQRLVNVSRQIDDQVGRLAETSEHVTIAIGELEKTGKQLAATVEGVSEIRQNVSVMAKIMSSTMQYGPKDKQELVELSKGSWENKIAGTSVMGLLALYVSGQQAKHAIPGELQSVFERIGKFGKLDLSYIDPEYAYGFLIGITSGTPIEIKANPFEVSAFPDELISLINEHLAIRRELESKNSAAQEYFSNVFRAIDEMYNDAQTAQEQDRSSSPDA